jgi:hypothetical protein
MPPRIKPIDFRPKLVSHLLGMTWPAWRRALMDNRVRIAARYWPRAGAITAMSLVNWLLSAFEQKVPEGDRSDRPQLLFLLGHWGSGTTWLHSLIGHDTRFASPTLYQVTNPSTFLTTQRIAVACGSRWMPRRRVWDNVGVSLDMPMEDELALCAQCGLSPYMAWAFPQREMYYDRYLTMQDVAREEIETWSTTLIALVRKLAHLRPGKLLVLKSPPHLARIPLLLELFPDAKFIHLHRHPYDVFHATQRLYEKAMPYFQLQKPCPAAPVEGILRRYRVMFESFADTHQQIDPRHYHEIRFADLEADSMNVLRRAYHALDLPDFEAFAPELSAHVEETRGYVKNVNTLLDTGLKQQIDLEWRDAFDRWGYERTELY